MAQAGSEEVVKRSFENRPGVEYKLSEDGIQSRRLSWLQASEGSSKLLRPLRVQSYCDAQVLESVEVANMHTGVWERRDGRWRKSRAWRFVDANDLISCDVYAQPLSL